MWSLGGSTSGRYGEKDTEYERLTDYWNPRQKKTARSLYEGVIAPGFQQYGNVYVGQPTDIEQSALSQLQMYGQQTPQYMGDAGGALSRALTGQGYNNIVDPAAAERLYGAIESRTMKDILPKAIEAASTQANVGGMLRGGTGQQLVTDEIGRVSRALSEQLAGLKYSDEQTRRDIAREREGRQLQAIPQVGNLSGAEFSRIMPGLQYGGMSRDIAGTQYNNPLTQLAMAYLGLRGREKTEGRGASSGWDIGQTVKGGWGMT